MIKYRIHNSKGYIETLVKPNDNDYETIEFFPEELEVEEENRRIAQQWGLIRERRNELLKETDWTQLPDNSLTVEQKQAYQEYRQALRDITLQENPLVIIYPEKPLEE